MNDSDTNDSEQSGSWLKRLSGGLARTSSSFGGAISDLVSKRKLDADAVEDLESELIRADLGPEVAQRIAAAFSETSARFFFSARRMLHRSMALKKASPSSGNCQATISKTSRSTSEMISV